MVYSFLKNLKIKLKKLKTNLFVFAEIYIGDLVSIHCFLEK